MRPRCSSTALRTQRGVLRSKDYPAITRTATGSVAITMCYYQQSHVPSLITPFLSYSVAPPRMEDGKLWLVLTTARSDYSIDRFNWITLLGYSSGLWLLPVRLCYELRLQHTINWDTFRIFMFTTVKGSVIAQCDTVTINIVCSKHFLLWPRHSIILGWWWSSLEKGHEELN